MKKVALITGASAGLGKDLAGLFAADGHDVVLVARREDLLNELAAELGEKHQINAHVLTCDLAQADAANQVHQRVVALGLTVTDLVNNAGFGSNGAFVELPLARELDMVTVNIRSLVALTHLFLPAMVQEGDGRVLNLGSVAGFQPGPFMATYYATKAFVNHFSEALSHELAETGVTVTVSCPGPTATEFAEAADMQRTRLFRGHAPSIEVATQAYRAMQRGRPMIVHGAKNRLLWQSQRLAPRSWVRSIAGRLNSSPS